MSFPHLQAAHTGASASAAMGTMNHLHAKQMGFQAAQRLQMAKALGGSGAAGNASPMVAPVNAIRPPQAPQAPMAPQAPGAPQGDFRDHVAQASGLPGVSVPEVHNAIGALAQAGQFSPIQAHALVAHRGPLQGQSGAQTVGKIAQAMKMIRARRQSAVRPPMPGQPAGMPTNGPVAGGGMPAGMGQ